MLYSTIDIILKELSLFLLVVEQTVYIVKLQNICKTGFTMIIMVVYYTFSSCCRCTFVKITEHFKMTEHYSSVIKSCDLVTMYIACSACPIMVIKLLLYTTLVS